MVELANTIWADGPSADPDEPNKALIREWGSWIEGVITGPRDLETVTQVRGIAAPYLAKGRRANIPGREYVYDTDSELTDNGVSILKPAGVDIDDPGRWVMQPGIYDATFELTFGGVGSGADFTDLEEALSFCSQFQPIYVYGRGGLRRNINLRILAGTTLTQGICAEYGQLMGHIRLVSDDAIVPVNFPSDLWFAYGEMNSVLPVFGTIFDLQGIGYDGVSLKFGSQVQFEYVAEGERNTGVINAARHNVFLNTGSKASLRRARFTGAGASGIHLEKGCHGTAREADVSNSGFQGLHILNGGDIDAYGLVAENCAESAVRAELGSRVSGFGIQANGCGGPSLRASQSARIIAPSTTFGTQVDTWAYALDGGYIDIQSSTGTGGPTVCLANGGEINARNIDGSGVSGTAFRVLVGGIVRAAGTTGSLSQTANTTTASGIIFR